MTEKTLPVIIGLSGVIVAVKNDMPLVFTVRDQAAHALSASDQMRHDFDALPFGPFDPIHHETLELGLKAWVSEQTPLSLGYVEQLYTFGNKGRHADQLTDAPRIVSVGYLALTADDHQTLLHKGQGWRNWYDFFPYEDWRTGKPAMIDAIIIPHLLKWIAAAPSKMEKELRHERAAICFALEGGTWDEEKVLERHELLYEVRLSAEALRDKNLPKHNPDLPLGEVMLYDHRRILATAMGRLRGKLKYRPVIFELMDDEFTLFQLQRAVEAITGQNIHKQNFRRLVETSGLVEDTGKMSHQQAGRPAALFRFRRDVLIERIVAGVRSSR
jgi:hypothetical protein